jgi:hypothetical protein
MKICEKKNWSTDDWKALSDDAQLEEIAWHEFQTERLAQFLDTMLDKLPRDKENKITTPEAYTLILLKRLELL